MVGFVILHYKSISDTIECIESVLRIKGNKKILVVDNHSLSKEELKKINNYPVEVLCLEDNFGFAKANNAGCNHLMQEYNPDFIAVLNNDIVINDTAFIDKILSDYHKYNFDILGPKIICDGDSVNPFPVIYGKDKVKAEIKKCKKLIRIYDNAFLYVLLKIYIGIKHFFKKPVRLKNGDKLVKNVALHGCAIIFSNKYLKKYEDAFYNETFLFHEEEFIYIRIVNDMLTSIYDPKIELIHKEGSSIKNTNKSQRKRKLFKEKERLKSLDLLLKQY